MEISIPILPTSEPLMFVFSSAFPLFNKLMHKFILTFIRTVKKAHSSQSRKQALFLLVSLSTVQLIYDFFQIFFVQICWSYLGPSHTAEQSERIAEALSTLDATREAKQIRRRKSCCSNRTIHTARNAMSRTQIGQDPFLRVARVACCFQCGWGLRKCAAIRLFNS